MLTIFTQTYGLKYPYLTLMICIQFYGFKYSYHILLIVTNISIKYQ